MKSLVASTFWFVGFGVGLGGQEVGSRDEI